LGLSALPIIRVGEDYETSGYKAFLEDGGVPTDGVTQVNSQRTSMCYLLQNNEGEHITLFYPGAMDEKFAKPPPDDILKRAGMGVITVGSRRDNEEFFIKCKQQGIPLIFGMKGDMDAFPPKFLIEILHYCKIIFTNEQECLAIQRILGTEISDLLKGNTEIIVTTAGEHGSRISYKSHDKIITGKAPAVKCSKVIDTSGSGDGYMSGFLYGFKKGFSVEECALLGAVLASFIIEKEGCCTGAPTVDELLERYRNHNIENGGN
jgi:adenosine kinase